MLLCHHRSAENIRLNEGFNGIPRNYFAIIKSVHVLCSAAFVWANINLLDTFICDLLCIIRRAKSFQWARVYNEVSDEMANKSVYVEDHFLWYQNRSLRII